MITNAGSARWYVVSITRLTNTTTSYLPGIDLGWTFLGRDNIIAKTKNQCEKENESEENNVEGFSMVYSISLRGWLNCLKGLRGVKPLQQMGINYLQRFRD